MASYRDRMHANDVSSAEEISELLRATRRIAVLGMRTEAQPEEPAFSVPQYCIEAGFDVVPVPVYYPDVTTILGRHVFRRLVDVPAPVDMVNVFRRSRDLAAHLEDILAAAPKSVWLQTGIKDVSFTEKLRQAGIRVVQGRCLMVELRQRQLRCA